MFWDSVLWSVKKVTFHPYGLETVWRKENQAFAEKNTAYSYAWWGLSDALHPLALKTCSVWKARWIHWSIKKFRRKRQWGSWSMGLPTGQWSQAHLKFHQSLVAEEVLEDSTVIITVTTASQHANPTILLN